jgi:hypothetical protein
MSGRAVCLVAMQDGQLATFMATAYKQIKFLEDRVVDIQKMDA